MKTSRLMLPVLAVLLPACTSVSNFMDAGKTD
jgi:hypothetical protein